ncbi:ATP-binding protein [Gracilinema caldarium]|uniref:ATP-binding protein n=1 Tax=Gracilinema caldarium TaxID=215591 RepID=UPI0026EE546E|nr:ATP-binding protein [Gracilinema caldarium]
MRKTDTYKVLLCTLYISVFGIIAEASPRIPQKSNFYIDLNTLPVYVHPGFSLDLTTTAPDRQDPAWHIFEPTAEGPRIVRFLEIPELPKGSFFSFKTYKPAEYTFVVPFDLDLSRLDKIIPGIHLAALGDNWEIYLNGIRIRSEMHLDNSGNIISHRSYRDVYFPINPVLFVQGQNILAFRVIGEPNNPPVGFFFSQPYVLTDYAVLENFNNDVWSFALCAIYIFIGFYHLVLYLFRRQDRYNLFYGLFSMVLGLYLAARLHSAYLIVPDSEYLLRIEFTSLYMVMPLVSAFIEVLSINKTRWGTRIMAIYSALLSAFTIFTPLPFAHDILRIWQISALGMALYIFVYAVLWDFISTGYRRWKRNATSQDKHGFIGQLGHDLIHTPLGNILIGAGFLFFTAIFDILDSIIFLKDIVLSRYGLFVFTIGSALILANRYGFLFKQLNYANANLENRLNELSAAKATAERNERKYRSLFNGTNDPIVLLDKEFRFKECNTAAIDYFNLEGVDLSYISEKTPKLYEKLYEDQREHISLAERFAELGERLFNSSQPIEVQAQLRSPLGDFKSCTLRMESIKTPEGIEILLRVIPDSRDDLAQAFVEGREHFEIENTLSAADDISRHVCANLSKYMPQEDANFAMVCVREIIINAIEHGNLEITFDEKSKAQRERRYFEFLQERKDNPAYKDRRVQVEYSITPQRALFRITDEGKGFNHQKFLEQVANPNPEILEHGRGLFMTLAAFDRVVYNDKGNQVTLEKRFNSAAKR